MALDRLPMSINLTKSLASACGVFLSCTMTDSTVFHYILLVSLQSYDCYCTYLQVIRTNALRAQRLSTQGGLTQSVISGIVHDRYYSLRNDEEGLSRLDKARRSQRSTCYGLTTLVNSFEMSIK